MTQRSQSRQHTGKRGASENKEERKGYRNASLNLHWWHEYSSEQRDLAFKAFALIDYPVSPHRAAAFRKGAEAWASEEKNKYKFRELIETRRRHIKKFIW